MHVGEGTFVGKCVDFVSSFFLQILIILTPSHMISKCYIPFTLQLLKCRVIKQEEVEFMVTLALVPILT